jgi:Ca2+-binding RTX toxin-like protein
MTSSNGRDLFAGRAESNAINGGNRDGTANGGAGSETLVYNFSESIVASLTVPCAMDARPCRGHLAGGCDSPAASVMCRGGLRNAGKKISDDSQVDLSEMAERRIAYAAKVAEFQYRQAKRICDEINGMPIGKDDPMVLAVLKAISTNYAALVGDLEGSSDASKRPISTTDASKR